MDDVPVSGLQGTHTRARTRLSTVRNIQDQVKVKVKLSLCLTN
jgi:hypothetical protein